MSKENVKKFMEEVQKDKELQEKIMSLSKNGKEISAEEIAVLAGESGFSFTVDELNEVVEEKKKELMAEGELDEAALEQIAGGGDFGQGFLVLSVATLGFGCVIGHVVSEAKKGNYTKCTDW